MQRQIERRWFSAWPALVCFLAIATPQLGASSVSTWPDAMLADADLHDVFFLDGRLGWAVGDRGVIWHTYDGGQSWRRQNSSVTCRLESVFFLDENTGWAVGGWTRPYRHRTTGVVLRTDNGGRKWSQVESLTLPWLKQVYFSDSSRGWAVGYGSFFYPAGVFYSSDGGRRWSTVPGNSSDRWVAAAFPDSRRAVAINTNGTVATLGRNGFQSSRVHPVGARRPQDVEMDARGIGYLVGDGGLVLTTRDAGATWGIPPARLPHGMEDNLDFRACALRQGHCWIAGSPGTTVLHTADGGRHWDVFRTGHASPIRALCFVDNGRGWAVGSLGMILHTDDGGVTWTCQAGASARVGILGIYDRPESVPWELMAHLAGSEGCRTRVVVVGYPFGKTDDFGAAAVDERLHDASIAVSASGADVAWQFPVRSRNLRLPVGKVVDLWNQRGGLPTGPRHDDMSTLEAWLVRTIRTWRPDVVFTASAANADADGLSRLVRQNVERAAETAANPGAYTGQITAAKLQPWRVKHVYLDTVNPRGRGSPSIPTARLVLALGRSLSDLGGTARGLVCGDYRPSPAVVGYVPAITHDQSRRPGDAVPGRAPLSVAADGKRPAIGPADGNLQQLQRLAQRRRNIDAMLARLDTTTRSPSAWLTEITGLTDGFDPTTAGETLYQLAQRYQIEGHAQISVDVLGLLQQRYPGHPLAEAALAEQLQYYSSAEMNRRYQPRSEVSVLGSGNPKAGLQGRSQATVSPESLDPLAKVTYQTPIRETEAGHLQRLSALEQLVHSTRPDLLAEPEFQMPLASADRRSATPDLAEQSYRRLHASLPTAAWRACAVGEIWLRQRRGEPPKTTLRCTSAEQRPRLDGRLDDVVWQNAPPVILRSPLADDSGWPASVWLAHDEEFLFLAARGRKAVGAQYPPGHGTRPRDPDIGQRDRIDIYLDVNRDYSSYWRLSLDHRGWTGEACLADRTWNPTWYVAASDGPGLWQAEAAIPLAELVDAPLKPDEAWAVGIQRTVPGVGFQSWTRPASPERVVPEGFGYVIFQ